MAEGIRFCLNTISRTKRHPTVWENIFIDNISNKGLPSKICIKSSHTSTHKKQIVQLQNGQRI